MSDLAIQIPEAYEGLFSPSRYKVYYGGRGGAKSFAFADALLIQGMETKHRILCAREIQKSIRDSVHKLIGDRIATHGLDNFYTVRNDSIKGINGTEFIFRGLKHNAREIKSTEGVTRCWVEEAENVSDNSWEILIPTIRAEGSEIWIGFNPKNPDDPTFKRFVSGAGDDMLVRRVSWRDNPWFPEVLKLEMDKLKKSDFEAYKHVWEGDFDTRKNGAVYAKQLAKAREERRIASVPYDPSCEVFTAWDLGFGDATAIWFLQFVGRELRWIDYYENSGEQLDHYVSLVKGKPYNYMKTAHYIPHDGGHGNIRGESVTRQLSSMGLPNVVLPRDSDINAGIELLRQTIAFSAFDAKRCSDGLHALNNYAYEWDEDRGTFKKNPSHTWASHAADAARYAAQAAARIKGSLVSAKPVIVRHNLPSSAWMG